MSIQFVTRLLSVSILGIIPTGLSLVPVLFAREDDEPPIGEEPVVSGRKHPSVETVNRHVEIETESDAIHDDDDEEVGRAGGEIIHATPENQQRREDAKGEAVEPQDQLAGQRRRSGGGWEKGGDVR